jgi:hypothetical protein
MGLSVFAQVTHHLLIQLLKKWFRTVKDCLEQHNKEIKRNLEYLNLAKAFVHLARYEKANGHREKAEVERA